MLIKINYKKFYEKSRKICDFARTWQKIRG